MKWSINPISSLKPLRQSPIIMTIYWSKLVMPTHLQILQSICYQAVLINNCTIFLYVFVNNFFVDPNYAAFIRYNLKVSPSFHITVLNIANKIALHKSLQVYFPLFAIQLLCAQLQWITNYYYQNQTLNTYCASLLC
jgi:hypothetical protein